MTWSAVLLALLVSHAVGDVLLQTDWQATNKVRGLGDATSRRALAAHLGTYMLAFVPALVWIADRTMAWRALVVLAIIVIPHLAIDDGRIVRLWLHRVKGATSPGLGLSIAVDQSLHVLCLLAAALIAAA